MAFLPQIARGIVFLTLFAGVVVTANERPPAENLVPELNFQNPVGWSLGNEGKILSVGGKFSDQVVEIARTDRSLYQPVSFQLDRRQLRDHCVYHFGAWVQGSPDSNPSLAVEFYADGGEYLSGVYLGDPAPSMDQWHLLSGEFTVPEQAERIQLTLFLPKNRTGVNRFCGLFATPAQRDPELWLFWKTPRGTLFTDAEQAELRFGLQILGLPESCRGQTLTWQAAMIREEEVLGQARGTLNPEAKELAVVLPVKEGYSEVEVILTTPEGEEIARRGMPLAVAPDSTARRDSVRIDERGRIRVNGEKFLPVGLFLNCVDERLASGRVLEEDLAILAASPFNCILDYSALSWPDPEKVMKFCEDHQIKVIAPMAADRNLEYMAKFDRSPALLAWYVADEPPGGELENILARKKNLTRLDPWHPTLAVFCRDNDVARFAAICDLYGLDHYSITGEGDTLDGVARGLLNTLAELQMTDPPLVAVPQFHNIGNYAATTAEEYAKYRAPTEMEMRTSVYLDAIMGAKAFLGYSYFDLYSGPEGEAEFARRWPEICRIGGELREMSDFILGDTAPEPLQMIESSGKVYGALFTADDGRRCVLLAAPHGPVKAVFSLPEGWRPAARHGIATPIGDGRWEFSSHSAAAEWLIDK